MASRVGTRGEDEAKERWLIKKAIELLDKFSAGRLCLDDFIIDASNDLQGIDPQHKSFILDIISGCIEYKNVLDVVIDVFYGQKYTWIARVDRNQFVAICYLVTFLLDNVGMQFFTNVVRSLEVRKMHTFLSFFVTNLTTWIQDEWNKIYDASYVEENWISPFLRWRPDIEDLVQQLAVNMSCVTMKKGPVKTTKPQEFGLTKPKPRPLTMPELIPSMEKSKPAPRTTYRAPKEMKIIEELKQKNQQSSKELQQEANTRQFGVSKRSEGAMQRMAQLREDMESQNKFKSFQATRPLWSKIPSCPIRLNSAAKLRQLALRNQQEQQELRRIKYLVEGGLEPSSFKQWQGRIRERELQEEVDKCERKHLEGSVSHDRAAVARTRVMELNQKSVQTLKEKRALLMRKYADKRMREDKGIKELVQHVAEGRKNSKEAKEKLFKFKQSLVKEVSGESQKLLRQALEDSQAELSRKFQIIREINIMESLPHMKEDFFDDTEIAGHRVIGEMSIAELRVRLANLKDSQNTAMQKKRKEILDRKESKKQQETDRLERLEYFSLQQKALARAAAIRKEEEKAKIERFKEQVQQSEKYQVLRKEHEELCEERQRLKEMEKMKAKLPVNHGSKEALAAEPHQKTVKKKDLAELQLCLERHLQDSP